MRKLLVIDDETSILHFFRRAFGPPNVELFTAASAAEGIECVRRDKPDVVILDIHLPDGSGLEVLKGLQKLDAKMPVIFITGHGTTNTAIEAMRLGAYEYLLKPLELDQLVSLVERAFAISRLMRVPAVLPSQMEDVSADVLVGRCPAMQEVYKAIGRVAPQDVTVLILGESGTGKELVARAIYHYSRRSAVPFLAINCAAIPEALLESELFGHEKGSFTGADRKRIGKFEQANGGTLFLDEIGDMTPLTQTKILRVLQDQQFERVGGNETIRTNVRVIAATNRNLDEMMAAGQFRSDLYYRLNTYVLRIPPLRNRLEDLPLLAEHLVRLFARELGKDVTSVSPATLDVLCQHPWPGNVRELQSVLKQALLRATGPVLVPEFLPEAMLAAIRSHSSEAMSASDLDRFIAERLQAGSNDLYAEWLALVDRHLMRSVLRRTDGNLTQTAKILGINRATLRSRLQALGLHGDRVQDEPG